MVQLYKRLGSETLVNTTTAGAQIPQDSVRLSSGGYVVAFLTQPQFGAPTYHVQAFDASGAKVGGEGVGGIGLVALASGYGVLRQTGQSQFALQRYTDAGGADGAQVTFQATAPSGMASYGFSGTQAAVLPSGRIVLTWAQVAQNSSGQQFVDVYTQMFEATGTAVSAAKRVNFNQAGEQDGASIAVLSDGSYAIVYRDSSGAGADSSGESVRVRILDGNGNFLPVGEIVVNTTTDGHQYDPAVVALVGGGFAVSWTDASYSPSAADNSDTAVKAQIFTNGGVKVGGEILVNTVTAGMQAYSDISSLSTGGFVVSWTDWSLRAGDSDRFGVAAQIFDSAGAKVGSQFLVNTVTKDYQDNPSVVGLASGGFAVAWSDASGIGGDPNRSVKAQIFAPSAAGPGLVTPSTNSVSETALGNYAVATISDDGGVNSAKTYALVFDSTGGAFRIEGNKLIVADNSLLDYESRPYVDLRVRVTDANGATYEQWMTLQVVDATEETRYTARNDTTVPPVAGDQDSGSFGALAGGGYVAVWVDKAGADASGNAVVAQRFDASGAKVGTAFVVNAAATGDQSQPKVAGTANGGFVVTWTDASLSGGDSSGTSIKARLYNSSGTPAGGEFLVNSAAAGNQNAAAVTALEGGRFLVTWQDDAGSGFAGTDLKGQIYDSAGARVGGELALTAHLPGVQHMPHVAARPGGGFLLVFADFGSGGISAQFHDASGGRMGDTIAVATTVVQDQLDPVVASLAGGRFVVAWTDASGAGEGSEGQRGIKAQMFEAGGWRVGGEFVVNTTTIFEQSTPTIVALPWGGFMIGWQDLSQTGDDPIGYSLRAQMFTGEGGRVGGEFIVNQNPDWDQKGAAATVLSNGSVVFGWTEAYSDLQTVFESRLFTAYRPTANIVTGTDASETLQGSGGDDVIFGLGGNDVLIGAAGLDTTDGGPGDDVHHVDQSNDVVVEREGEGNDRVITSVSYVLWPGVAVETLAAVAGTAWIDLTGNAFANRLEGNDGGNRLDGGAGADVLLGGRGDDVYVVDNVGDQVIEEAVPGWDQILTTLASYSLAALPNVEVLAGLSASGQVLTGNDLSNGIYAGAGNDLIDGGAGTDYLRGGPGDDVYIADTWDDIGEDANAGHDEVRTASPVFSIRYAANVEDLTGTGFAQHLYGNTLANRIRGTAGNDVIGGYGGADSLEGGAGDDIYLVDDHAAVIVENPGEGRDQVQTLLASYSLAPFENVEDLRGFASTDQVLAGNARANRIIGHQGNDTLDGGAGADEMTGGWGSDVYIVDDAGDQVIEMREFGIDEIRTPLSSYSLAWIYNVENLTGTSAAGQTLTGNELANAIVGGSGNDSLDGGEGDDSLSGGDGNDAITGGTGADRLQGGTGADRFVYFAFSNSPESGMDRISDFEGGVDRIDFRGLGRVTLSFVHATEDGVPYTLVWARGASETLVIRVNGTRTAADVDAETPPPGTAGDDVIEGTDGPDDLNGLAGNDRLFGLGADDSLQGGEGDDVIDGGAGADLMAGGSGNDVYHVDVAGDRVVENAGEGTDEVRTALAAYSIAAFANVEILTGTYAYDQTLTGNDEANLITGGAGWDTLRGMGGNDTLVGGDGYDTLDGGDGADIMRGGAGDDVYLVDQAGDQVIEDQVPGWDGIRTALPSYSLAGLPNVERLYGLSATGQALTGNQWTNWIEGGAGNDVIDGGAGADYLRGGGGDDVYIVDEFGEQITELPDQGRDEVRSALSSVSLQNTANVEDITATGLAQQL